MDIFPHPELKILAGDHSTLVLPGLAFVLVYSSLSLYIFRLTVRGLKSDQAVVCTNNKTYLMREQETSNSLLVVPDLSLSDQLGKSKPDGTISMKHSQVYAHS